MTQRASDIVKKKHNAPAFHYLFFNADPVLKEVCQGYQNVEKTLAVDTNTSFNAFSVTKTFTAVTIMQLVEKGKIRLDDPIDKYLVHLCIFPACYHQKHALPPIRHRHSIHAANQRNK